MTRQFDNTMRHNWGYEDGQAHRARGKSGPCWARCFQHRPPHPFDKHYGIGYWKGFYGEAPENKHAVPA